MVTERLEARCVVVRDITFGDWVRQRRRALDLTQAELADRVAYSAITVRRVEAGMRRPSKELVERLAHHLGVPDDEMAVFRRLGRRLVGPASDSLPPAFGDVISCARRAVPYPLSEMVGRSSEESQVLSALRNGARLVTLSGPGGVGKTRLAMSIGHRCAEDFDEVCWVPLSGLSDPDLVIPAVTDSMGLGVSEGHLPAVGARYLVGRRWLVILDTLEHLLDSTTRLTALLHAAPNVSMIVTTRTALRVPGEVEVVLAPLAVPETAEGASPKSLLSYPSVAVFRAAACRAQSTFALTRDTGPAVVSICRQVDGLPLGLEIAANNLRVLSIHDLAARTAAGMWPEPQAGRSARHLTLQTTLDASFALLSPSAQLVLARAAAFSGEWSLAAAEAVCTDARVPVGSMLSVHAELRDHSMISVGTESRATRYAMLSTVRRYSQQRLSATGTREDVEQRHIAYFAGLASKACGLLVSSHQVRCLELISEELDNFRTALDRAMAISVATADPAWAERVLLTTARLERFWSTTGRSAEGMRCTRDALALPTADAAECVSARGEALGALAVLETMQHQFDRAWQTAQQLRQLAESCHDRTQLCVALRNLGTIAVLRGDIDRGEELLRSCLGMAEQMPGKEHIIAWTLAVLGSAAFLRADFTEAAQRYEEAVPLLRDLEDLNFLALTLRRQGQIDLRLGRTEKAVPLLLESLQHNLTLRSPGGIAACLVALADADRLQGQLEMAAARLGRAQALLEISEELLTRPDEEQHDSCRAAIEDRLGRVSILELLATGSGKPLEQDWLS